MKHYAQRINDLIRMKVLTLFLILLSLGTSMAQCQGYALVQYNGTSPHGKLLEIDLNNGSTSVIADLPSSAKLTFGLVDDGQFLYTVYSSITSSTPEDPKYLLKMDYNGNVIQQTNLGAINGMEGDIAINPFNGSLTVLARTNESKIYRVNLTNGNTVFLGSVTDEILEHDVNSIVHLPTGELIVAMEASAVGPDDLLKLYEIDLSSASPFSKSLLNTCTINGNSYLGAMEYNECTGHINLVRKGTCSTSSSNQYYLMDFTTDGQFVETIGGTGYSSSTNYPLGITGLALHTQPCDETIIAVADQTICSSNPSTEVFTLDQANGGAGGEWSIMNSANGTVADINSVTTTVTGLDYGTTSISWYDACNMSFYITHVTINPPLDVSISVFPHAELCIGEVATATVLPAINNAEYVWTNCSGQEILSSGSSISFTEPTTSLCVEVTDENGCVASATQGVTWVDCNCGLEASFSSTHVNGCGNYSFMSNVTVNSITEVVAYSWDFGDGTTSTQQNPSHGFENEGIFTVTLTVTGIDENGQCCSSTASNVIKADCKCSIDANYTYSISIDGCTITLHDNSTFGGSTNAYNYEWNMGDGTLLFGEDVTYTYDGSGTYDVVLTVTGNDGNDCCEDRAMRHIKITCHPHVSCMIDQLMISSSNVGNNYTFTYNYVMPVESQGTEVIATQWTLNGVQVGNLETLNVDLSLGNNEICVLVVTQNNGNCCTESVCEQILLEANCLPDTHIKIQPNENFPCQITFAYLGGGPTDGDCGTWVITDENGVEVLVNDMNSGFGFSHVFDEPGTYTVCHTACCQEGGLIVMEETCEELVITSCDCIPDPSFASFPDQNDPCHYTFGATGGSTVKGGTCMAWTITGPDVSETFEGVFIDYIFPSNGLYNVCFTACCQVNGEIFTAEHCETVEVAGCSCEPNSDFGFQIDPTDPCCYTFAPNSTQQVNMQQCQYWEILAQGEATPIIGTGVPFTHCFDASGNYQVSYTACCWVGDELIFETSTQNITVQGCDNQSCVPDASFTITQNQNGQCCFDLVGTSDNPAVNAGGCNVWRISQNGTFITSLVGTAVEYCFTQQGQYTIDYRACCSENGTISYDTQSQTVSCGGNGNNGGFQIGSTEITVGENIMVYPNPTSGNLNIKLAETSQNVTVKLMDLNGRIVLERSYTDPTQQLDLDASHLPNGTYHMTITTNSATETLPVVLMK